MIIILRDFKPLKWPIKTDAYLINKKGEVYSTLRNKMLSGYIDKTGYRRYRFNFSGDRSYSGQRLVLSNFLEEAPQKNSQANHKDGDKLNNSLQNLEWVSPSENIQHSYDCLRDRSDYEILVYNIKGCLLGTYPNTDVAAEKMGISDKNTLCSKVRNKTTYRGYLFFYKKEADLVDTFFPYTRTYRKMIKSTCQDSGKVKIYTSMNECGRSMNVSVSTITKYMKQVGHYLVNGHLIEEYVPTHIA